MNVILLSLVLLAGDDLRDFVASQLAISACVTVQTKEEGDAIDRRAMRRYGWKLCVGSCQMVCASHGGGWKWLALEPTEKPDCGEVVEVSVTGVVEKPAPPPQTTTRWERRGLFRWVQVTVPLETTPRPKVPVEIQRPAISPASRGEAGRPVGLPGVTPGAAASCPNGQCPVRH